MEFPQCQVAINLIFGFSKVKLNTAKQISDTVVGGGQFGEGVKGGLGGRVTSRHNAP
jgi:hypothetical protein